MEDITDILYPSNVSNPTLDAFSRTRISQPLTLFDSKQLVDNAPLAWDDQQVSGTATSTFVAAKCCSTLAVNNLTAGRRVRQTFERFAYQPGKSQYVLMTAMLGNSSNGITKRLGYYDDNNGVFFQTVDGQLSVGIRNGGVDTIFPQPNWNQDSMDGTGPSKVRIDLTKVQIFSIDFEWLGAGSVRWGLFVNGQPVVVHLQDTANFATTVYNAGPNQPLRYEIVNSGSGPAASMDCICGTVMSEAGYEFTGVQRTADTGSTVVGAGNDTNHYALIAIRIKAAYIGAASIEISSLNVATTATILYRWSLLMNPTLSGTALTWTSAGTNSAVEYATPTASTLVATEGIKFQSGYVNQLANGAQTSVQITGPPIRMGASIAGISDIILVSAQRASGSSASNYLASISWREQL